MKETVKYLWSLPGIRKLTIAFVLTSMLAAGIFLIVYEPPKATAESPEKAVTKATETTKETTEPKEAASEDQSKKKYFDVPLTEQEQDRIFAECEKHNISPALVVALIERESKFDRNSLGDDGRAFGLMQIQAKWHLQRMLDLNCTDLLDPLQNITVGIDFLGELAEKNNSASWVLMAYNGGMSYANRKAEAGETSEYASSIMARAFELESEVQ